MACRSPTPASCPIVLDRKEPGRELEPLQGLDQGLAVVVGEVVPVAYHGPTDHLRLEVMGGIRHLSSAAPPDGNDTHLNIPALVLTLASPKHTLPRPRALLPSQFIRPHPAPCKSLRSSFQCL